jgi:hypothetical protein
VASLSRPRSGHEPKTVHVGFVVDKMALGEVFLQVPLFYLVNIIPPWFSILIYHLQDEK